MRPAKSFPTTMTHFNISIYQTSWLTSSARLGSEGQLSEFIEGLGPGQLVGRQVLASPALGDIQLSMSDRRGHLEVEVIRARGLQCKPGSKTQPGKYFFPVRTGNLMSHDLLKIYKMLERCL